MPRRLVGVGHKAVDANGEGFGLLREPEVVERNPRLLHAAEHADEGLLKRFVDRHQPILKIEPRHQHGMKRTDCGGLLAEELHDGLRISILCRNGLRALAYDALAGGNRTRKRAGGKKRQLVLQMSLEHIAHQHRVVQHAAEPHALGEEDMRERLRVMCDLGSGTLEPGTHHVHDVRDGELLREADHEDVLDGKRDAERGRLCMTGVAVPEHRKRDGHGAALVEQPACEQLERHAVGDFGHGQLVGTLGQRGREAHLHHGCGGRRLFGGSGLRSRLGGKRLGRKGLSGKESAEIVGLGRPCRRRLGGGADAGRRGALEGRERHLPATAEGGDSIGIGGLHDEGLRHASLGKLDRTTDRGEAACVVKEGKPRAQIFARLALHFTRMSLDALKVTVFGDPLGGGLRTALLDAGHVVDLVAHEGEVVDDALRRNAVLFNDALAVVELHVHRVDEHDVVVDELGHVLVARGDDALHARGARLFGDRRDHVVGLDAGHRNDGPAEVLQNAVKRFDLHAQVVGHRRTVALVLGEHLVAEVLPLRVEDDDGVIGLGKRPDLAEHAQKAPDGPRRLARTRAKVGKAVKGAEKIVGAVDEKNLGHVGSRCCKCMNGP